MFIGIVIGFCLGYLLNNLLPDGETHIDISQTDIDEAIKQTEKLLYGEPYISLDEERALKKVIEYAKEQLSREDDLK